MDDFVPALRALRSTPPDVLFRQLHATFSEIARMDESDVIAATQTVRSAMDALDARNDPIAIRLLDALRVQMYRLCAMARANRHNCTQALGAQLHEPITALTYPRGDRLANRVERR